MAKEFLIGADGVVWPGGGRLGEAQCERLISNSGFIKVHLQGASVAVRLNADVVSGTAVGQLLFDLLELKPQRVELSWFDAGWHAKEFLDTQGLVKKLTELTVPAAPTYRVTAHDLFQLPDANLFAPLLANWRAQGGGGDAAEYLDSFPDLLRERFFLLDLDADRNRLTFDRVGLGFPLLSNAWAASCGGAPFEEQADYAYACAVARAYRQVGRLREPLWEHVEASIDVPQRGPCPVRYQRLILPILGGEGTMQLLGTTFLDSGVKIGVES